MTISRLSMINGHTRDKRITFKESNHTYTIDSNNQTKYISVTTLIKQFFKPFSPNSAVKGMFRNGNAQLKYPGMTPDEIKKEWIRIGATAREQGLVLHNYIEKCLNCTEEEIVNSPIGLDEESKQFKTFVDDHPTWKPYRTEWRIFDDTHLIAGSIDCVFEEGAGEEKGYILVDWKRSKNINMGEGWNKVRIGQHPTLLPDTNYTHYTLQLNLYKYILENYYGIKIRQMFVLALHPNYASYVKIPIRNEPKMISTMIE